MMGPNGNNDWKTAQLGDVIDLFDSQRVPLNSRERQERRGQYPYYGAQGIIDHIDDYIFDGRYILVAEDGENLNSKKLPLALFATGKFWVNNHAHILRGKAGVADDSFLLACLNNADIRPFVTGAAQPKLSQANMRQIEIPLPPLPVQRRIAGILSAYDDLIKNSQRRIRILETMARALYREWFVLFRFPGHENCPRVASPLGDIPKGWEYRELSELGFVGRGKSRHRPRNEPSLYGGPYPFFQTGDIKEARIFLRAHSQTYSEAGLAQSKLWQPGTLCITIAANIADTAILAKTACFPDSVVGFIASPTQSDPFYVKMYLDSIKLQMQNVSRGTTQDNLSLEKLLGFRVLSPSPAIIQAFRDKVAPMLELLNTLLQKEENLRRTRDLLLPRLLSGQVKLGEN